MHKNIEKPNVLYHLAVLSEKDIPIYNALCECRGYRNAVFSVKYAMMSQKYLFIDTVLCKLQNEAEETVEIKIRNATYHK
jgi:hypothetical protein